ncbi:MAG: tetratricopeptide repeat protein [Verrucomicrobia bacterium]|nr:tetratricopeptide repeat protein [Verrucomicrobiota bacterium]
MNGTEQRKLAAIMFTDMVGYTALTQGNEKLALELLEEHRRVLRELFPKFNGREIETTGDGFLVEFASALEAARCAIEIQRSLATRNIAAPSEKQIHVRIGIHVGDVVQKDGKLLGDGVNIAARLEPLAEPGGICVSNAVYEQVRNKLDLPLVKLGTPELKNIRFPIAVYKMAPTGRREPATSSVPLKAPTRKARAALDPHRMVVLPLDNLSPDAGDEYFARGMTEELTSRLSRVASLTVIGRTSAEKVKKDGKSVAEIGRALQVGAVLEGSVRKAGNQLRITVQLIDVATEGYLLSVDYDREFKDVFAIQSGVAQQVVEALQLQLGFAEAQRLDKRPTDNLQAYGAYLKGRHHWSKRTADDLNRARDYFVQAIEEDPNFGFAYASLASTYVLLAQYAKLPSNDVLPKGLETAAKALQIDRTLGEAHAAIAAIKVDFEGDWDGAGDQYRRAIEENPNDATIHLWYGINLGERGRFDEALAEIRRAQELDPLSPVINVNIGDMYHFQGQYEEAIAQYRKTLELDPHFAYGRLQLGSACVEKGSFDEAIREMQRARAVVGNSPFGLSYLGRAYALSGRRNEASQVLDQLEELAQQGFELAFDRAVVHNALGESDEALHWLENAVEEHADGLADLKAWPMWKNLRDEPRFKALLKRVGLEK